MSAARSFGTRVQVTAPARLHLGFLDLSGQLGRRFGSVGLALDYPSTSLGIERAARVTARGPDAHRALGFAEALVENFRLGQGVRVVIHRAIPAHAGLGSGTQLALAIGRGIAELFDVRVSCRDIATLLGRGARSGIGIGAFEQGGFLVDGGIGKDACPPPVITRMSVPDAWRVLLIFDDARHGMSGAAERRAFSALGDFPDADAGRVCRLLLMEVLPALAEADIRSFGRAITELQNRIGDYFSPVQGGRFSSPAVAEALAWMSQQGAAGTGQSSWGPTGFALCEDEDAAGTLQAGAEKRWGGTGPLRFAVCGVRNTASVIEWDTIKQTSRQGG